VDDIARALLARLGRRGQLFCLRNSRARKSCLYLGAHGEIAARGGFVVATSRDICLSGPRGAARRVYHGAGIDDDVTIVVNVPASRKAVRRRSGRRMLFCCVESLSWRHWVPWRRPGLGDRTAYCGRMTLGIFVSGQFRPVRASGFRSVLSFRPHESGRAVCCGASGIYGTTRSWPPGIGVRLSEPRRILREIYYGATSADWKASQL